MRSTVLGLLVLPVAAAAALHDSVVIDGTTVDCHLAKVVPARHVGVWAIDPATHQPLMDVLRRMDTVTWSGDGIEAMARFEPMYEEMLDLLSVASPLARDTTDSAGGFTLVIPAMDSVVVIAQADREDEPVYYSHRTVIGRTSSTLLLDMTRGQCIPDRASEPDRQVAHLTQGDYEEMAFSPSGRYLALADRVEHRDTVVNQLVLYDFDRQRLDTILTASAARRYVHYAAIVFDLAWEGDSMLVAAYHDGDVVEIRVTLRVPDGHRISEDYDEVGIDMPPVEVAEAVMRLYPEARGVGPESTTVFNYALSGPTIRGADFIVFEYRVPPQGYGVWLYGLTRRRIEQLQALPDSAARFGFVGGFVDGEDVLFLSGSDTLTLNHWRSGRIAPVWTFNNFWQHTRLNVRGSDGERTWFVVQRRRFEPGRRDPVLVYENGLVTDVAPELATADMQMHFGRKLMALSFWQGTRRQVVVRKF